MAARIVRHFKADTFRVIEEEPERLSEVKGISEKMAMAISDQVSAKKEMRQAMMFLQDYGISMNLAAKIFQEYGPRLYSVIKENPYRLADDIPGVGFKKMCISDRHYSWGANWSFRCPSHIWNRNSPYSLGRVFRYVRQMGNGCRPGGDLRSLLSSQSGDGSQGNGG